MRNSFISNKSGTAAVEFALVSPVFFLLIFGMFEFGLFMYHKIMIENIAIEAGRVASLGKTSDSTCAAKTRIDYIYCVVNEKSKLLINGDEINVEMNLVSAGGTTLPDICLDKEPPSSDPVTCKIYEEVNGVPGYQGYSAANNIGQAGDVIEVTITYPWKVEFPLMSRFFGVADPKTGKKNGVVMITSSTVIKNEAFQ